MQPTIGRIVHFITDVYHDGEGNPVITERPAIVTEVHEEEGGLVSVVVFGNALMGASVPKFAEYDESKAYGTWHWPERA